MYQSSQNPCGNRLLASLRPDDGASLISLSRIEHPTPGRVLMSTAEPVTEVWFPHAGAVALITSDASGRTVQTGMVGPEGCIGLKALFGENHWAPNAVVQIGGAMSVIPVAQLRAASDARPELQMALSRYLFGLTTRSLQIIACNRLHNLLSRCCRWLLTMQDKANSDEIPMTQEKLALLVGGGRPRVNAVLAALEKAGLVHRRRGRIALLDRAGLEQKTCECYHLTRDAPKRLAA